MKDYKVIVTETKIVEVTATAPSAEVALEMVTTLKTKTPLIDNSPNAETVTLYSVFEKGSDDNDEEESKMDETTEKTISEEELDEYDLIALDFIDSLSSMSPHDDNDEEKLIDEIY